MLVATAVATPPAVWADTVDNAEAPMPWPNPQISATDRTRRCQNKW